MDQATDTVYVANSGGDTVSVIDGANCNANVTSGCAAAPPTVPVGTGPDAVAVDETTNTIYVTSGFFDFTPTATMSVIDGATCNASTSSGCGQVPATMVTGGFSYGVAVDEASGTVVVDSTVGSNFEVFDGATCNAVHQYGCSQVPRTVPTGGGPANIALDQATSTAYAGDNGDGEVSFVPVVP